MASDAVPLRWALSCANSIATETPPVVSGEVACAAPFDPAGSRLGVNNRSFAIATGGTWVRGDNDAHAELGDAPHLTGERLGQTDAAVRCRPARDHALMHGDAG